jgi:hypothetical protein
MYVEIFNRYAAVKPPFHNHVLRGNYNLAAKSLMEIIRKSLSMLDIQGEIYCCRDGFEAGFVKEPDREIFSARRPGQWRELFTMDEKNRCLGLFDDEALFYMRVGIEPVCDISEGEVQSGFFELYGRDGDILKIYEALKERFEGFFIVESAKKHLDEIWI